MNLKTTLTLLLAAALCAVGISSAQAATINVPVDHVTIQAAIDAANPGDTIEVAAGTYAEVLTINKSLSLLGPNAAISAVTGTRNPEARLTEAVNIGATADVTVSGFEFFEVVSGSWTIYIQGNSNNFTFENNRFIDIRTDAIRSGISANTANLTVTGNLIEGITEPLASGLFFGGINGTSVISNNSIDLAVAGVPTGYSGIQTPNATDLVISGNEISNTTNQGLQLAGASGNVTISNNVITNTNTSGGADKGAIRLYGSDFTGPITISGNTLTGSFNGVSVKDGQDISGIVITVEDNDLSGNSNAGVYNGASSGTVDASSNYWGVAGGPDADPSLISGDISYTSWYSDAALTTLDGPIENITQNTFYATIQAAIDAATAGDTIEVAAGTYTENLVVDKALTLTGPNVGTGFGSRSAEAVIAPPSGLPVSITADGVTLDGFEITAPGHPYAVSCGNTGNLTIQFNHIHDVGTGLTGGNVHAINYTVANDPASTSTVVMSDNLIENVAGSSLSGASASAIGVLQSTSTGVLSGLSIERNTISNVAVNSGNWPTGKIAYGIQINVAGGGSFASSTGKIQNVSIVDNSISNLSGFISTGIGLEGNTETVTVSGNTVASLSGRKVATKSGGGYDLSALKVENNRFAGTVTISENSFQVETFSHDGTLGRGYAISNYVDAGLYGTPEANNNWLGSGDAADIEGDGDLEGMVFTKIGAQVVVVTYYAEAALTTLASMPVENVTQNTFHGTIQAAINAATAGDTIEVAAGTYKEALIVDRSVTLHGPNAGINPNTGVRVAEAIIMPGTSNILGEMIYVEASDVTIDGFTIDGDNPDLTSGFLGTNGADLDAAEAVTVYEDNVSNLVVTNNAITNLSYFGVTIFGGSYAAPASSGHEVSNNLIEHMGTYDSASGINRWGGGVLLYNSQYCAVTDNVMTNVRIGVQSGNFHNPNPGTAASLVISDNEITTRGIGIFFNLMTQNSAPYTVSGNQISAIEEPEEPKWRGMLLASLDVECLVENNDVDGSGATAPSSGLQVWNVNDDPSRLLTIRGGSVTGVDYGVWLNNYDGYSTKAADGATAIIEDVTILNPVIAGIYLKDNSLNPDSTLVAATVTGTTTVTGGSSATGILVEGASTSLTLTSAALNGVGTYIALASNGLTVAAADVDATAVAFDGKLGSAMTEAEFLAVEPKVMHKNDLAALGLVTWLAGSESSTVVVGPGETVNDPGTLLIGGGISSLTVNGGTLIVGNLDLQDGSVLDVVNGELVIGGSTIAGSFTFFNSFGSINFNDDVSIAASADGLILISDVHVADGATITVDGNLVIDGSVVDSPGRFDLVVEPTGEFTMARTVFDSGDIVLNSATSSLYDNRFVNATISVAAGVDGAEVYHNITDDLAWLTDNGTNTVTMVDAWGNLTDASLTQNNLLLGLDIGTLTDRTQDSEGNIYIQPSDTFLGTVDVSDLQTKVNGFEILLGYNTNFIDTAALLLEDDWDVVIDSVDDDSTVIGKLDRAIGLSFGFSDPAGSSADQNVTDVEMTAGTSEGETLFFQRVKLSSDTFGGETRLTAGGATPSFLTPFTANSGTITVDGTAPMIADTATYASVTQGGDDMTATGILTIQGNLDIKAAASDALAGIDAVDAVMELVGPATYTATQAGTSVITVGSEDATEYDFDYEVTASTQNGVYNVEFTVTDRSGNQSTEVLGAIEINKNQVDLEIELQGLVAGPLSRDVELVFTDISGTEIESRTESIVFTNGIGSLTLNEVDGDSHRISAKTAWTLRQRLEIGLDTDGQATVAFTGTSKLLGGDINADNVVNMLDYSILRFYWNDVNSQADITGSGGPGTVDFSILQANFYTKGAAR